jgi:hypothetical protein
MRVKYAEHVINTIRSGTLRPGALWVSGILDDKTEALKTLQRHAARKRREAERKLAEKPKKRRAKK